MLCAPIAVVIHSFGLPVVCSDGWPPADGLVAVEVVNCECEPSTTAGAEGVDLCCIVV
jgi:hypothetical protein